MSDPYTLIGMIGSGGPPVNGEYEIGYSVLPAYRRRGYASEALGALLTWGFAQPETEVVVAHTYPHLHASIGVLLKNGFSVAADGLRARDDSLRATPPAGPCTRAKLQELRLTSTRRCAVAFLISLIALTPHCKRKAAIPPDVIVRVDERFLTLGGFKRYLQRNAGTDLSQLTPEVSSAMLDQYIEEILLSEYAASNNIEVPAEQIATSVRNEPGATIIEKRDEMRRQKLIAELGTQAADPTEAELRAYYEQHMSDFRSDEELRVKQILVHDERLANEIIRKLKSGGSFEDLSTRHSRAPNAKRGGGIGYVSRGELPRMFEDEIFRLRPGETSSVIRTDAGFHIFKVEERRPAGTLDFRSSAPLIRERLRDEALRGQMARTAAKARGDFPVAVLTKRLSFTYSGTFSRSDSE